MKRRITVFISAALLLLFSLFCTGCVAERASDYTDEEHLARVTERIEKKYMTENSEYTSFAVYPLYNENDKLEYFLVEFEPSGFLFVQIRKSYSNGLFSSMYSLYGLSDTVPNITWCRYTLDPNNSEPWEETKYYECDENGEKIMRYKSPYAEAGIQNEKKYLLSVKYENKSRNWVFAIKAEKGYLNLVSMREFLINEDSVVEKQASIEIAFPPHHHYDL